MRNRNKQIKTFSTITLILTLISLLQYNYSYTPNRVEAAINPNESPIAEYTLANGNETHSIRSEMDKEGNQYLLWQTTEAGPCSNIYLQVFNKSGIPITQPKPIAYTCIAANSFIEPDISVNDNNIAISYTKKIDTTFSVEMLVLDRVTYSELQSAQQVDSGLILDASARPRIASNEDGTELGIAFQSCDDVSCVDHNVYFQGYNSSYAKAHGSNILVNANGSGNQTQSNISYSGSHFLVVFTESGFTAETTVQASAINYLGTERSAEINIEDDASQLPDVGGTLDVDLSATPNIESFYVAYNHEYPDSTKEIQMKKVYCEYTPGSPGTISCNKTSRGGEPVYVRVSEANNTEWKGSTQVTVFKNNTDIKRVPPYENTNIDEIAVTWEETNNDIIHARTQSYTNTLTKNGGVITSEGEVAIEGTMSISANRDGHFVLTYNTLGTNYVKAYPSKFLKTNGERLVNAPDIQAQENPAVSKNSDGSYVIVYQSFNGIDYDIHYAVYNKYGDATKNIDIANSYTTGDQINPKVAYWNEDAASPDYGKFVIIWEGQGSDSSNGIYMQEFNPNGTTNGSVVSVQQNSAGQYVNSNPDLATGTYKQTAIIYKEHNTASLEDNIILYYLNDGNTIYSQQNSVTGDYQMPLVSLSPEADGTLGAAGKSKFATLWNDDTNSFKTEGYLSGASSISIANGPTSITNYLYEDIDSGYNATLSTLSPALDPFYYAATLFDTGSGTEKMQIMFFDSAYSDIHDLETNSGNKVSIDPASQNIFSVGQKFAEYNSYVDPDEIILTSSDAYNNISTGDIHNEDFTAAATVTETGPYHAYITRVSGNFSPGERIGPATAHTPLSINSSVVLSFATDISTHFTINQTVSDSAASAQGDVKAIGNYYVVLENISGTFSPSGGTLDNAPFNDSYTGTENGNNIYFSGNEGNQFEVNNYIINIPDTAKGIIKHTENSFITVTNITGVFNVVEDVLDFNNAATIIFDPIEYIAGRYFHFDIVGNAPVWEAQGPTFSVNESSYYGQSFNNADIDYDTRNAENAGKFSITAYSNNSSPDYLDENGVFQNIIEDPFTIGQKEDLSPTTEQEVEPGGKYIIVPQTIDFGNVPRNSTGTVDFAALTPSCLTVTDLDGTDFDLTVSLTDLDNVDNPPDTISNSNFVIENNNGSNPDVISLVNFCDPEDVTLSPSTAPGQDANLGTTQTLLTKNKPYTGSWEICPKTKLTIPPDASSGNYSGTLIFTLI